MVEVRGKRKRTERITERDLEILEFVARFGVVPREVVSEWAKTGRAVSAARERRLREAGLIEVLPGLGDSGRLCLCTRRGLRTIGREELPVARFSAATLIHSATTARVGAHLERAGHRVLSEREIEAHERAEGKRVFSAECRSGRLHRPDLVLLGEPADTGSASDWGPTRPSSSRTPFEMGPNTSASGLGCQGSSSSRTQGGRRSERTEVRERADRTEDTSSWSVDRAQARGRAGPSSARTQDAALGGAKRKSEDAAMRSVPRASSGRGGSADQLPMRRATRVIQPIAVEVELSAKSARRLDEILRAWRRSLARGQFAGVRYLCSPSALAYVLRAVMRIGGDWDLEVEPLQGSGGPLDLAVALPPGGTQEPSRPPRPTKSEALKERHPSATPMPPPPVPR